MKSRATALFLSVFVGILGVDRFYLGYTGMGVLKLLTGGCLGILYILDILSIANGKLSPADGTACHYRRILCINMRSQRFDCLLM